MNVVDYLLEQLDDPGVSARAMFGGHGIYRDGQMFAIVYDDDVYMKFDDEDLEMTARPPFRPRPNQTLWSFRAVNADELEDRDLLARLAAKALSAAARTHRRG